MVPVIGMKKRSVASIKMPKFGVDVKPDTLASWLKIMKSQDMITGNVAVDKLVK